MRTWRRRSFNIAQKLSSLTISPVVVKPEHPISITKGQAEAALVLTDTALARVVDDAAPNLGHELLDRQVETRAISVASTSTAPSVERIPVSISFAVLDDETDS